MKRKILAALCTVVFSAMLAGCGNDTGKEVSSDVNSMLDPTNSGVEQQDDNTQNENINHQEAKISKEKAKEIALKHAKLSESDITDYEIDLDTEDGKLIYDISFESNGKEYDYDVDANTGDVANSKNEIID